MLDLASGDTLMWEVLDGIITIYTRKKEIPGGICGMISSVMDAMNDKKRAEFDE